MPSISFTLNRDTSEAATEAVQYSMSRMGGVGW